MQLPKGYSLLLHNQDWYPLLAGEKIVEWAFLGEVIYKQAESEEDALALCWSHFYEQRFLQARAEAETLNAYPWGYLDAAQGRFFHPSCLPGVIVDLHFATLKVAGFSFLSEVNCSGCQTSALSLGEAAEIHLPEREFLPSMVRRFLDPYFDLHQDPLQRLGFWWGFMNYPSSWNMNLEDYLFWREVPQEDQEFIRKGYRDGEPLSS